MKGREGERESGGKGDRGSEWVLVVFDKCVSVVLAVSAKRVSGCRRALPAVWLGTANATQGLAGDSQRSHRVLSGYVVLKNDKRTIL